MTTTDVASGHTADSLSRHRSVWEMRADGWIGLVDDLGRLATLARSHADFESTLARVRTVVAALAPIESYWAFPGGRVFGELGNWIERGELAIDSLFRPGFAHAATPDWAATEPL